MCGIVRPVQKASGTYIIISVSKLASALVLGYAFVTGQDEAFFTDARLDDSVTLLFRAGVTARVGAQRSRIRKHHVFSAVNCWLIK